MMAGEQFINNYETSNRKHFSILSFVLIIFFLSTLILLSFYWNSQKKLTNYLILNQKYFLSTPLDSLITGMIHKNASLKEIQSSLEKVDFVASSKVYKKDSETLVIDIVEKEPLLIISDKDGNSKLLTSDLKLISTNYLKQRGIPKFFVENLEASKLLKDNFKVFAILRNIKWNYPEFYWKISEIQRSRNEILFLTNSTRTKILMDENRCETGAELIQELFRKSKFPTFLKNEIDLRYDGLVILR
jgi:hypothetical protein